MEFGPDLVRQATQERVGPIMTTTVTTALSVLTLEHAVQLLTSRLADAYRIPDRGRLVPGAHADILMFDPETVGRGEKHRVHDLPAGASRVDIPPFGVHGVWVNGQRVVDENGAITDCGAPGKLIREFAV